MDREREKNTKSIHNIVDFYKNHTADDDFDEIFYKDKYPETNNFCQPFCKNNNISDKQRLYFHWHEYNRYGFKNLKDQQKQIPEPKTSPRSPLNKLAVLTSFFNPCNYTNPYSNYLQFASSIKKYASLFTIELSFNNNFIIKDEHVLQIKANNNNVCWQKEALLNILLSNIPKEYTDIAWIDCDILFDQPYWVDSAYAALNKYKIVQLFRNVAKVDINGNKIQKRSIVSSFPDSGESGFAWAARREVIDELKLLDNQIFGGADIVMASAFMNRPHLIKNQNYIDNESTKKWINTAIQIIEGSVSYIDTDITHLYHGSENNRILARQHKRSKLIECINYNEQVQKENGIWSVSNQHYDQIYDFFISRKEDDNIHIQNFLDKSFDNHEQLIESYMNICETIMYSDPSLILKVKDKIVKSIVTYAMQNCSVYQKYPADQVFTRIELSNKQEWISCAIGHNSERILHQQTSGSTTGKPFNYYTDHKYFDYIQRVSEFELILKEFDLYNRSSLKILNLFKHHFNPKPKDFFIKTKNYSKSRFHTYGSDNATTFFVNWDVYISNPDNWHGQFLNFLSQHYFDIVLCSGPVINILNRYIKKHNFNHKFAFLLSHTTEYPKIQDFEDLKQNNNIDYYCDHMRCYDGGANFFTCIYGTYHLNDNLAWVSEGADHKMISTDYFNIVAPFVNYWNGDLCKIENEYKLCECGRWYRPFKMLQNRPFALKGPTKLTEIRQKISTLDFKNNIDQIQFENFTVNIYLNAKLNNRCIDILKNIMTDYQVKIYD